MEYLNIVLHGVVSNFRQFGKLSSFTLRSGAGQFLSFVNLGKDCKAVADGEEVRLRCTVKVDSRGDKPKLTVWANEVV